MEYKDYYQIMGVEREASQDDIKRAYRKLSRKYHPDVSKESDAELRFKEIGEAYEVLKDPEKRVAYNQLGSQWKSGQGFQPPPDWDEGFEFNGGGYTAGNAEHFSDFFEQLFGGRGGRNHGFSTNRQSMHGQNTHAKIVIDLDDSYKGANKTITLKHSDLGADGRPCIKERTLNVRIPKGVSQGQKIRLAKQGGSGTGQEEAGDLYLEIQFNEHPFYKIEGKDVYLHLPITPWEAALGEIVKMPTPTGYIDLKIPPASNTGRKMRLKERGVPAKKAGDLYVILDVVLPKAETDEAKNAYQAFKKAVDFNPRNSLGV